MKNIVIFLLLVLQPLLPATAQVEPGNASEQRRLLPTFDGSFNSLQEARIIRRGKPAFTAAMRARNPGTAKVRFDIAANNSFTCKIIRYSSDIAMDKAVLKACAAYRWKATRRGGTPIASSQMITFDPMRVPSK